MERIFEKENIKRKVIWNGRLWIGLRTKGRKSLINDNKFIFWKKKQKIGRKEFEEVKCIKDSKILLEQQKNITIWLLQILLIFEFRFKYYKIINIYFFKKKYKKIKRDKKNIYIMLYTITYNFELNVNSLFKKKYKKTWKKMKSKKYEDLLR